MFRLGGASEVVMSDQEYIKGLASVWPENEEQSPVQAYFTPPQKGILQCAMVIIVVG